MRKHKLSLVAASLLLGVTALAGCSKNNEEGPSGDGDKTVTKLSISGIPTSYEKTDTIEWNKMTITATYGENKSYTIANDKIVFASLDSVTSETAALGDVVVDTHGLYGQSAPLTENTYQVEAALSANLAKKFDLGKIFVGWLSPENYELTVFAQPENIATYEANRRKDTSREGSFYSYEEILTVGTRNVFKYEPSAEFEDEDAEEVVTKNYDKTYSLKLIGDNDAKTPVTFNEYASVVKNEGVKFGTSAIGKKFELTVEPTDFDHKLGETTKPSISVVLKVEDGLNIYSAKELGALNLTHYTANDFKNPATAFAYHYGDDIYTNSVRKVFYDGEEWVHLDTTALWRSWLVENHVFTAEEEVAYQDLPAVFLQNDVEVGKSDIPSEFFIHGQEKQTADSDGDGIYDCDGCLRDYVDIYKPIVDGQDVVVNGNYFALDSRLGNSRSRGGSSTIYYDDNYVVPNAAFQPGHSSLIKFCGFYPQNWVEYYDNKTDLAHGFKGVVKNVSSNGYAPEGNKPVPTEKNPGETDDEFNARVERVLQQNAIMSMTSLIFVKNAFCGADYVNNVIKQYQIGLFPDDMVAGTREHAGAHGEGTIHFNTLIKDCRVYDCPNCGICNWHNGGVVVEHSDLERFGGSSLVNMGYLADADDIAAGAELDARRAVTLYMDDVITKNPIDGSETYFKTVNANQLFTLLTVYSSFIAEIGNSFRFQDDPADPGRLTYNLLSLNMDGSALGSNNKKFYADFVFDYNKNVGQGYLDSSVGDNFYYDLYDNLRYALAELNGQPRQAADLYPQYFPQVPLFVTDGGDTFTSLFNGDSEKLRMVTFDEGDEVVSHISTSQIAASETPTLHGKKLMMFLPAGNTTLVATFELR